MAGFNTSEGKTALGGVAVIALAVISSLTELKPDQIEILQKFMWPLAVIAAAYIIGRSITKHGEGTGDSVSPQQPKPGDTP